MACARDDHPFDGQYGWQSVQINRTAVAVADAVFLTDGLCRQRCCFCCCCRHLLMSMDKGRQRAGAGMEADGAAAYRSRRLVMLSASLPIVIEAVVSPIDASESATVTT